MNEPKNLAQQFIDIFEDRVNSSPELSDRQIEEIGAPIRTDEQLREGLPVILGRHKELSDLIENCNRNIKFWQENKKKYDSRAEQFVKAVTEVVRRLRFSGTMKATEGQLSTRTTSTYEVDEKWILDRYAALGEALQAQLPAYVKVKLSVDKKELNAHLKRDATLLLENPEHIHAKENLSVTLKPA